VIKRGNMKPKPKSKLELLVPESTEQTSDDTSYNDSWTSPTSRYMILHHHMANQVSRPEWEMGDAIAYLTTGLKPRPPLVEIVRFGAHPLTILKRVYKGELPPCRDSYPHRGLPHHRADSSLDTTVMPAPPLVEIVRFGAHPNVLNASTRE
ncbi:hypothetical protein HAX54_051343, partial [Datura stramonium]|nr:hypothetical protein [Datura stramonium]